MNSLVSNVIRPRAGRPTWLLLALATGLVPQAVQADDATTTAQVSTAAKPASAATTAQVASSWATVESQRRAGNLAEAERTLRAAATMATSDREIAGNALRLGTILVDSGKLDEAEAQLDAAQARASSLPPADLAMLPQARGALAVRRGDYLAAEQYFAQASDAARAVGSKSDELRAGVNGLRARMDGKRIEGLEERLATLQQLADALPLDEESATLQLAVGELHRRAVTEFRSSEALTKVAHSDFTRARQGARTDTTRAYALGLLGRLYEDARRWDEAAQLTTQALFLAQSASAPDQLFRWEWQLGRIQREQNRILESAGSFDRALATLAAIRADVLQSVPQAFAGVVEPAYLDYADVHLRQAAAMAEGSAEQQAVLRDVRDELESLKRLEIQDYFEDECVSSDAINPGSGFDVAGAAVVYPIMLADRMEVLIETRGQLRRFSAPVSRGEATVTVRRLRVGLERPSAGDAYLEPAQSLYRWLLGDAQPWLEEQGVTVLAFVPSGALRTIPLSVLHDGQRFLVERFAVATTPAVSFVPSPGAAQPEHLLVAGLSEGVQGFTQLPGVLQEVQLVSTAFPAETLRNETFRLAAVEKGLSSTDISAAHLASHGEFSADHRQSFVLTYDDRLTMAKLQAALGHRRDSPLDLLVLSACKTAAGDDRAALGLAGVAVQSGARSAVASLWYISDAATASLMQHFYQNLKTGGTSKAESLRGAQMALLQSTEFRHPSYWAPYLLIGNWM